MEPMKDSAVGIIPVYKNEQGEFLFCIVHEADGHWGFPKGHQESGESEEQTARRELLEETGIAEASLDPGRTFSEKYSFERDEQRVDKTVKYFLGAVRTMDAATADQFKEEIPELRWLEFAQADTMLTFEEAKNLLHKVKEYLESKA